MKKILTIVVLLVVSLMFLTACSNIVLENENLVYNLYDTHLKASFDVNVLNDEVEFIDYDLNIYGKNEELLHTEHYEKVKLRKNNNGSYYVYDFYCDYPKELQYNEEIITGVTITNIKPWFYSVPIMLFVFISIASVAMTIVLIAVVVKRKPAEVRQENTTEKSNNICDSDVPSNTRHKE